MKRTPFQPMWGILNAGGQIGSALGLATLVSIAVSVLASELAQGVNRSQALVDGFSKAYTVGAGLLLVGAVIAASFLTRRTTVTESAPMM